MDLKTLQLELCPHLDKDLNFILIGVNPNCAIEW